MVTSPREVSLVRRMPLIWGAISGLKRGAPLLPLLRGRVARGEAGAAGVGGGAEAGSAGRDELATWGVALAAGAGALAMVFEDGPMVPPRAWLPGIAEPPVRSSETETLGSGSGTRDGEDCDEDGSLVDAV